MSCTTTPLKKVPIHLQSAQARLLIKNGKVVNHDGVQEVDIYIEDAKIKQMGTHLIIPGGTRAIDAAGKYVIPGGIDANVHLQRPHNGMTQSVDDFYRGTRAAIVGGTTTVIDTVVPSGGESLIDAFRKWRGWADDKVCCDYGLKMALPGGQLSEEVRADMADLTAEDYGVNAFHISMLEKERRMTDPQLTEAFEAIKDLGGLAMVHAETGELVDRKERIMKSQGVTGPEGFAMAHTENAEEEATMRATTLANQVVCPVHIGPVMSANAMSIVAMKKGRGNVVFAETTPAALACSGEDYWNRCWRHAAGFVTAPPVRKGAADDLVEIVAKGENDGFDLVTSDNCTWNSKQKAMGADDFTKIPKGVNGVEERMSILWEKAVHTGKMSPERFVALTSAIPAKMFNLYPAKGRLEVGSLADVVIWDPKASRTISAKDHQLKVDFNVFEGQAVHGHAETVIVRGRVMIDEGLMRCMQGFGNYLPLAPFAPYVYDKVARREEAAKDEANGVVERTENDMAIVNGGDIPPLEPVKPDQPEASPSQHISNLSLGDHPNPPDIAAGDNVGVRASPARSSVRVRAPPGGRSSGGFW